MPDTKITALTAIATVDPAVDVLPIVDVSDTSMAASGTTKKITSNQILGAGGTATLASATITGAATAARLVVTGSTAPANGVYLPAANSVGIATNSIEAIRIDASQNVGVGVVPSAWNSGYKAIDLGSNVGSWSAVTGISDFSLNAFFNASSQWIYKSTAAASLYRQQTGQHIWFNAPSGTAGNAITFTQAMALAANGQLLLGTSTTDGGIDLGMVLNKPSATGFVGTVYRLNDSSKAYTYISSSAGAYRVDTVTGYTINMVSATNGVYLANGGTSWTALSDERFKDIIEPISNAVAKVGSIRSVIGKFKTESEGTRRSFLVAQDVQAVLPEAVDASNPDRLGVAYTEVIPLLVAAIKELTAEVNALKNA